jgi:diaminohydroxyphosphoribosylaminopyrimidine deaminase/5-amino-6-(5-phosphoribosylamino)uracil reductase
VVYAAADPNPKAAGGAEKLEAAGIAVTSGVEAVAARRLNRFFHHLHENIVPYVTLKLACSLDGRIAKGTAERTRLTGDEANAEVHRLRAGHDAILVGIGTVLADDPLLTVRGAITPRIPPARVVFDSQLRLPLTSRLLSDPHAARVFVVAAESAPGERAKALEDAGAYVIRSPDTEDGLEVEFGMQALYENGLGSVLVEGGARVAGSLMAADLVERLTMMYAPVILGDDGVPAFSARGSPVIRLGVGEWTSPHTEIFGRDVAITHDRVRPPREPGFFAEE